MNCFLSAFVNKPFFFSYTLSFENQFLLFFSRLWKDSKLSALVYEMKVRTIHTYCTKQCLELEKIWLINTVSPALKCVRCFKNCSSEQYNCCIFQSNDLTAVKFIHKNHWRWMENMWPHKMFVQIGVWSNQVKSLFPSFDMSLGVKSILILIVLYCLVWWISYKT